MEGFSSLLVCVCVCVCILVDPTMFGAMVKHCVKKIML